MAMRNRMIKAEFFNDGKIQELSDTQKLFFIGLWMACDDFGFYSYNPYSLKGDIFSKRDDVTIDDIESYKDLLIEKGMLLMVPFKGNDILVVKNWERHQKIHKPSKRRFVEAYDLDAFWEKEKEISGKIPEGFQENSGNVSEKVPDQTETKTETETEAETDGNDSQSEPATPKKKIFSKDSFEYKFAATFQQYLTKHFNDINKHIEGYRYKEFTENDTQRWAKEVDIMVRMEAQSRKTTEQHIELVLRQAFFNLFDPKKQDPNFSWIENVQSIKKFRKHLDKLVTLKPYIKSSQPQADNSRPGEKGNGKILNAN